MARSLLKSSEAMMLITSAVLRVVDSMAVIHVSGTNKRSWASLNHRQPDGRGEHPALVPVPARPQ